MRYQVAARHVIATMADGRVAHFNGGDVLDSEKLSEGSLAHLLSIDFLAVADNPADTTPPQLDEPPRAGRGSSRDAWTAFAVSHGFAMSDDATRDDIISALVDEGVIDGEE